MAFTVKVIYKQPHPVTGKISETVEGVIKAVVEDGILYVHKRIRASQYAPNDIDVYAYLINTIHSFTQLDGA